jgi:hypothetical protein
LIGIGAAVALLFVGAWIRGGTYGVNTLVRHGPAFWLPVSTDSARLSDSMRLALRSGPVAVPGEFAWRSIGNGFDVGELPAIADGREVDRILVARIDPAKYRFAVRNAPADNYDLDQWMTKLGAALVVNGSYFTHHGTPDTPFISDGIYLGPQDYDAKAGAFVASGTGAGIRDLSHEDWKDALRGADNAMVSYPLLLADGTTHVGRVSRWLANRSFVGQDAQGRIIIGTTRDAFFSLDHLARFLKDSPLGLTRALNLDGGPVACQGIALNGFDRRTKGRWEMQVDGDKGQLLTFPWGDAEMPVVLAVYPR